VKDFGTIFAPSAIPEKISPDDNVVQEENIAFLLPTNYVKEAKNALKEYTQDQKATLCFHTKFGYVSADAVIHMDLISMRQTYVKEAESTISWCRSEKGTEDVVKILQEKDMFVHNRFCGGRYAMCELFSFRFNCWLNDVCVEMALRYVVDSLKMEYAWKITVIPPTVIGQQKKSQYPPSPETAARVVYTMKNFIGEQRGMVVLPINVNSTHWICLIINYLTKEFIQFDSLQDRLNYKIMSFVQKQYLSPLMRERTDGKPSEFALFKEIKDERFIQQDGYSCGVFITMFAEAYIRGYSLESSPAKISKAELENKRLHYFTGILRHQEVDAEGDE
jgi:hypothetical protein